MEKWVTLTLYSKVYNMTFRSTRKAIKSQTIEKWQAKSFLVLQILLNVYRWQRYIQIYKKTHRNIKNKMNIMRPIV